MKHKHSSLQKLPSNKLEGRLNFPTPGDTYLYSNVGKKHYVNLTNVNKLNVINYESVPNTNPSRYYQFQNQFTKSPNYNDVYPRKFSNHLLQQQQIITPEKKRQKRAFNINQEDSLSAFQNQFLSKRLGQSKRNIKIQSIQNNELKKKQKPSTNLYTLEKMEKSNQQQQRMQSPMDIASNFNPENYNISNNESRKINPTYLSSIIQNGKSYHPTILF